MDYAQTSLGTPFFLSPEICQGEKYNYKTDIWMLGCVVYELCSLKKPFTADNLVILMKNIVTEEVPPIPSHYSEDMRAIVKLLMKKDQNERPFIREVLEHDIVQKKMKELNIVEFDSPELKPKSYKYENNSLNFKLNHMNSPDPQMLKENNSSVSDLNLSTSKKKSSKLENSFSNQNLIENNNMISGSKGMINSNSISMISINKDSGNEKIRKKVRVPDKINKKYDSMGQQAFGKVMDELNLIPVETTSNK
jgi:NIMA (never in mitosis gene a)-related kinase